MSVPLRSTASALSATSYSLVTRAFGALDFSHRLKSLRMATSRARADLVALLLKSTRLACPLLSVVSAASGVPASCTMALEVSTLAVPRLSLMAELRTLVLPAASTGPAAMSENAVTAMAALRRRFVM